ncbi:hypothetical protein PQR53_32245 [Paraburkholderia fungorum]|uniref:hypothetical protein n=1 Tax=Paraburkholderia fungorum TaxID=134537 RepID=UPI0038BB18B6
MATLSLMACSKSDEPLSGATASDTLLRERITGLWHSKKDGESYYMDLTPSSDFKMTVVSNETSLVLRGTWKVDKGRLLIDMLAAPEVEFKGNHDDEAITSLSKTSLTLTDSDPKEPPSVYERVTQIATEDDKPLVSQQAKASAPQVKAQAQAQAQAQAAPAPGAAEPAVHLLLQQSQYVPEKQRVLIPLHISKDVNVKISLRIDQQVPIDLVIVPFKVTDAGYDNLLNGVAFHEAQKSLYEMFGNDSVYGKPSTKDFSEADLFLWPGAKKGAYGEFESDWAEYPASDYTIVLDNSGEITPSRGDAPVQIAVWAADK